MKARVRAGGVCLLVALGLNACTSGSKSRSSHPSTTTPGVTTVPATPLASATAGDFPGGRVDVYGLERTPDSLRLDFGVTNSGSDPVPLISSMQDPGLNDPFFHAASGVLLLDAPHGKEYRVLLGPGKGECRCSTDLGYVDAGQSVRLFAEFPLPPPDVRAVQVLVPHYAPMVEVAIGGSKPSSSTAAVPSSAGNATGQGPTADVGLEVYDVKRAGGFVVLRFGLHNTGSTPFLAADNFQAPELHIPRVHDASGVVLVDPAAQQKYLPLTDTAGHCLCSGDMDFKGGVDPGATGVFWVEFPAPPATTTSIQVFVPTFGPVSIPITGDGP
jgi:hypothetical protein